MENYLAMRAELDDICERYGFEIVFDDTTPSEYDTEIQCFQLNEIHIKEKIENAEEDLMKIVTEIVNEYSNHNRFLFFTKWDREYDDLWYTTEEILYKVRIAFEDYYEELNDNDSLDDYLEFCGWMKDWYKKGLHKPILMNELFDIIPIVAVNK